MKRSDCIKLIKNFLETDILQRQWFRSVKPHLKAIIFYGSSAKEESRPDSDIDILFIMPLKIEEKYTTGEYYYEIGGKEINIVIRSIERLRKIANGEHDDFQAEVFRKCEIVWQRDEEVKNLIQKIQGE